jgi:hypothetical protein
MFDSFPAVEEEVVVVVDSGTVEDGGGGGRWSGGGVDAVDVEEVRSHRSRLYAFSHAVMYRFGLHARK